MSDTCEEAADVIPVREEEGQGQVGAQGDEESGCPGVNSAGLGEDLAEGDALQFTKTESWGRTRYPGGEGGGAWEVTLSWRCLCDTPQKVLRKPLNMWRGHSGERARPEP